MAIIDWPDALRPASVEWGLVWPQAVGRSSFDGSAQATTIGAPRWAFTVETGPLRFTEVPQWEAFVDRLRGKVNRARAWDWRREAPLGVATGTPVVAATGSGSSVLTSGWTPSITGILLAGSWMGINGELKRLSADISSNGAGQATATFEPPLRASAPEAGAITLVKPTALFQLVSDRPGMKQAGARNPGMTLQFMEDFLP
jgi:hypothetical protein